MSEGNFLQGFTAVIEADVAQADVTDADDAPRDEVNQ